MDAIIGSTLGEQLGKLFQPLLAILVTGAVYFSTTRTTLRCYIAAENVSAPLEVTSAPQNKSLGFVKTFCIILASLVGFSLIRVAYGQGTTVVGPIMSAVFFAPAVIATCMILPSFGGGGKTALFKSANNESIFIQRIDSASSLKIRLILSTAIVVYAFAFNNLPALMVVYAGFLTLFSWSLLRYAVPLKFCTLSMLLVFGGIALSVGIIALIELYSSTHKSDDIESSLLFDITRDITVWSQRILAVESAFIPLIIVNTCLRFDYHSRLEMDDNATIENGSSISEPVPGNDGESDNTDDPRFVIISRKIPLKFRKTYFVTAMVSWAFSCFALMAVVPFTLKPFDFWGFEVFMMLSSPFILLAVLLVATARKQLGGIWSFHQINPAIIHGFRRNVWSSDKA